MIFVAEYIPSSSPSPLIISFSGLEAANGMRLRYILKKRAEMFIIDCG